MQSGLTYCPTEQTRGTHLITIGRKAVQASNRTGGSGNIITTLYFYNVLLLRTFKKIEAYDQSKLNNRRKMHPLKTIFTRTTGWINSATIL